MPGLDGTGPRGEGPRTGRGFGLCPPNVTIPQQTIQATPTRFGFGSGQYGRGLARGFRGGRGRRAGRW